MGLDFVELVILVEEHFEIDIPDEVAGTLDTPGKLKRFVGVEVGRSGSSGERPRTWSHSEISEAIDSIVEDQAGIERSRFHDDSHFVDDLGLD